MTRRRSEAVALAAAVASIVALYAPVALADGLGPGIGNLLVIMFVGLCALVMLGLGGVILLVWWLLGRRRGRDARGR